MKNKKLNRRQFLNHSGKTAVSAAALSSTAFSATALLGTAQLGAMSAASASTLSQNESSNDYKAMVCVLLAGGADSFNILVPTDNTHYQQYATTRSDIALSQSSLLALNNAQNNGQTLGLHPQLSGLQGLYNQGKMAFLSNVGTLVEPTSTQALQNHTAKLPLGLYSHSDQISQWQTALPDVRSGTGWGGRIADILSSQNSNQRVSMSISASGANEFQAGRVSDFYSIVPGENPTPSLLNSLQEKTELDTAVEEMYQNNGFSNLFRRSYSKLFNESVSANAEFASALQAGQPLTTNFGNDEFSQQMRVIARTIAANQLLGMRRQTFFVTYGGWDHHDEVINAMNGMLKPLNDGLAAFQSAIAELGLENNVTTFTTSDFARTLSSNGRGSDHAWGGNAMILGGAVKGGSVYGTYPSLTLGNPLDTGRGVLMPTTSLDEYFGELALWFGVAPGALADILPNIGRFYSTSTSTRPLGFMA